MTTLTRTPQPAATPVRADRDRTVDAVRVLAMLGVVVGHWLVTALVPGDGGVSVDSPLRHLPHLWPVTWLLQTLGLFFFAGGFGAAASWDRARSYVPWLRARLLRLLAAVAQLAVFWAVLLAVLFVAGVSTDTLRVVGELAVSPLWFLAVYVALTAAAPLLRAGGRRARRLVVVLPVAVVAFDDGVRFGPDWLGAAVPSPVVELVRAVAVLAAWVIPYQLGMWTYARPSLRRRGPVALLVAGIAAAVVLVGALGYPATAVGVTGAGESNLSPPTLVAVALAVAQIGAFLLVRPRLARVVDLPAVRGFVARANAWALPVFLWHQSALLLVVLAGGALVAAPGLRGVPSGPDWLLDRASWLPVVALVLAGFCRLMGRVAKKRRP
ncbi:MAG: acyltransferase family protein [Streptosporangiales bacterium]|nr:acyltransferase family protein [Streptosporangiales bacterium]